MFAMTLVRVRAGVHVCMCARVGTILDELSHTRAATPQTIARVDVVHDIVHACMCACAIGAAVGTILGDLSCTRCKQVPCRLVDKYSHKLVQILRSPC